MSSVDDRLTGPDVSDQLDRVWHGLVAAAVLIPALLTLAENDLPRSHKVVVVALVAGFLLWHWGLLVRGNTPLDEHSLVRRLAYWAVACVLAVLLAAAHPSFTIALYGLYPLMFLTLGWWGIGLVVGLTAAMGWVSGAWASGGMLMSLLTTAALAVMIAAFVTAVGRQSAERRAALTELAATRAELAAAARLAGTVAERERMARELHDTVAQGFTGVVTQLESAEQALPERPDDAREHLGKARRAARESLTELRRSVHALRPDLLAGAPLSAALETVSRQLMVDHGVRVEFLRTGAELALPPDTELALLRITQEALTNAGRHSRASRVVVTLSYLDDVVTLDVNDDGVGFAGTPGLRPDGGLGLVGMRERVAALGGTLSVESAPDQGTTIAVSVPV